MLKSVPALVCAAILVHASAARANQYEVFVDIDTEEDLYDLHVANQIDDDTFQTLLELYQRGVDLNEADRADLYALPNLTYAEVDAILAYRDEVGHIVDPAALVAAKILSEEKLEAIAAFLVVRPVDPGLFAASGWARFQTRYSIEDDGAPPMALQARVETLHDVRAGVAVFLNRTRLGDVRFDPVRQALTAEAPELSPHVPKFYVEWENGTFAAVLGTYRIGFGQRLTFDNTDLFDPDGFYGDEEIFRSSELGLKCKEATGELASSPCAGVAGDIHITPDFRWRESLTGAAVKAEKEGLGAAHAFVSYQPRSIYQYEIYDRGACDDPRNDGNPACSAPQVFRTRDDRLARTSRFIFQTLPDLFAETTTGGNLTYAPSRRTHIGVTGYRSHIDWLVDGIDLDFQEWSRTPFGGDFGALGVDAAHGVGNTDVFAEVARSFDSMPGEGNGGFGGVVRSVTSFGKNEVEASARYYDDEFANPHARPISAADELDGLRARDEIGGRVRYSGTLQDRLNLRTSLDVWHSPLQDTTSLLSYVRGDIDVSDRLRWGLWAQFQDRDLGGGGENECFETRFIDETGEEPPCTGQKIQLTGRVRIKPERRYWVDLQYQHELLDEARYEDKMRQDISVFAIVTAKPSDRLRVRARSRYLFEDISDNQYLEQSLWTYADLSYRLRFRDQIRIRYDVVVYLDDRTSTETRVPSPEQWMWLEYESKF